MCPLLGWRGSCRANVPSGCDSPEAPHHRHTGLGRGAGSCGRRACPPPPRRPFRGFSRSVRILGPPMGPRDGRRAGLPGGVALACAHTVQTGQEASPGPPSRVLSIGPSRLLLHLPSHQLSPSAEKSQAPAFHVTSPPHPSSSVPRATQEAGVFHSLLMPLRLAATPGACAASGVDSAKHGASSRKGVQRYEHRSTLKHLFRIKTWRACL